MRFLIGCFEDAPVNHHRLGQKNHSPCQTTHALLFNIFYFSASCEEFRLCFGGFVALEDIMLRHETGCFTHQLSQANDVFVSATVLYFFKEISI